MDPRAAVVDPSKVIARTIVGEGCWLWAGCINPVSGYGQFSMRVDGKTHSLVAHRLTYELFVGPIPSWAEIDHLCRVRACVRPDHLEAVSHSVNVRRGVAPERSVARFAAQTHCKQGHPLAGDNLYSYVDVAGYRHRQCITCRRATRRRAYERERAAA